METQIGFFKHIKLSIFVLLLARNWIVQSAVPPLRANPVPASCNDITDCYLKKCLSSSLIPSGFSLTNPDQVAEGSLKSVCGCLSDAGKTGKTICNVDGSVDSDKVTAFVTCNSKCLSVPPPSTDSFTTCICKCYGLS